MVRWAFDILGIEVTKDKRQIKKAYALLVRQYHPEEHPVEWTRIHEAYQTAMEYAATLDSTAEEIWDIRQAGDSEPEEELEDELEEEPEEESEEEFVQDVEIIEEAGYGALFQEEQSHWIERKMKHERLLHERLQRLGTLRRKKAVKEWRLFFETEFLPDEGVDALMLLLETVRGFRLPDEILHLIIPVMAARAERYNARGDYDCRWLAEKTAEHCQAQLAGRQKYAERRSPQRKSLSRLWIIPALVIGFIAISWFGQHTENVKVIEKAAEYLNAKYGEEHYTTENLKVEKEALFYNSEDELEYYYILEQASSSVLACAMRDLDSEDSDFVFFDNIQAEEIKQAFENSVNERTGHTEGRVFWNSKIESNMPGGIENNFFQTRYEGDFDAFIQSEIEVRRNTPKITEEYLSVSSGSLNGCCDYYLPDPLVKTLKEKLEGQIFPEDAELQAALEKCAVDYQIQIRGVMLPESYFAKKMERAEWKESELMIGEDVTCDYGLEPSASFLLMTDWYVNLPPEDEKKLKIRSGIYTRETILMGEGIYGAESCISTNAFGLDTECAAGSIQKIKTPEYLELSEEEKARAVSFQMRGGYELEKDFCLAIDKEVYGIANSGYRIIFSEQHTYNNEIINYETYALDYGADIGLKSKNVLDGEGYVFLGYPSGTKKNMAAIVTIVNP